MPRVSGWIRYVAPLVNLLVEGNCPLCARPAPRSFCADCLRQVQRCQLPHPEVPDSASPPVFAWGQYGGALKRAIATLKYENQPHLARPLGHWMGQMWQQQDAPPLLVVPIPMHREKQLQRGFNQAELLAESFCQITRLPLERQALLRVRSTEAQFGLSLEQRAKNLTGAMQVNPTWKPTQNRPILLIDDIYTTGATVKAATQALQQRGVRVYGVMALAKA